MLKIDMHSHIIPKNLPDWGKEFGYEDGWNEERNFYLYIGKGQVGNIKFLRGNKAIKGAKKL